jgi:nicotinamide phosphoribosyltransferase
LINKYYGVDDYDTAFSVPASEHSVMTALGEEGEIEVMRSLISKYPKGILSVVSDSYNIVRNVTEYLKILKDDILNRTKNSVGVCKYVVRPDSLRWENDTPEDQMLFIYKSLADIFGYTVNNKGHEVLNPKVGIIWGDGIDDEGCRKILEIFKQNKISTECLVFGMGGGLLQKISRDTQRFAFKCSARTDDQGNVINIQKNPMDSSKKSKSGLLKLIKNDDGTFQTVDRRDPLYINRKDELVTVFYQAECNGYINNFDKIRERAVVAL